MYRFSTRSLLLAITLLLIPITLLYRLNQKPVPSSAAWWNETWAYRRLLTVTNSGSAQNNVYITLASLDTSDTTRFQSDGGDIRVTLQDGALLDYYIVSGVGTTNTTLHINFDTLIAGSSTIYLYYGNASAANGFSAADFPSAASSSSPGSPATEETSPGPVLYYSFDEGIGTSATNYGTGSNLNGTFGSGTSSPSWTDGYSNKGISLDGTDYLNPSSSISLGDGTISAWVKFNTKSSFIAGNNFIEGYWFYWTGGLLYINWGNDWETFNDPFETNVWTHIATTRNGTNVSLYKNGVHQQTKDFGTSSTATVRCLGRLYCDTGSYQKFDGLLDEFKIYSRALSADEIKQEYNRTASTQIGSLSTGGGNTAPASASSQQYCIPGDTATCSPPVAEWKFDEGIGTTAYDTSGNSHTGVIQNGGSWTSGKFGKAIALNIATTANQYVLVSSVVNHHDAFTKEAWIYPTTWTGCGAENRCGIISPYLEALNGQLTYYDYSLNPPGWHSGGSIPLNQWTHVTVSFSNSLLQLYVNGIVVKSVGVTDIGNHTSYNVGAHSSGNRNFRGHIDNVRIFDYARTPGQILLDMNNHPPVSSPLLHYKFDEGYGTSTANSGIGGTNTGVFGSGTSAPTWTDGRFGKGLSFGGNDYLSGSGYVGIGSNPYTISCWLRATTLNGTFQGCFAIGAASAYQSAYIGINSANVLGGGYYNGNLATNITPTIGQWYHLVQTYSGGTGGHTIIYVDGVQKVDSTTYTPNLANGTYAIGYIFNPYWFYGSIDEVKYYNYALTPDEVKQTYNNGVASQMGSLSSGTGNTAPAAAASQEYCIPGDTTTCSPPIAEWKFDEGIGSTAYDSSGHEYSGTISGATWTQGKIGKALNFDGNNDGVLTSDLGTLSTYTLEAWVKPNQVASYKNIFYWSNTTSYLSIHNAVCFYAGTWSCNSTSPTAGQWTHIAITSAGQVYQDGVATGTVTTETTSGPLTIGDRDSTVSDFNGLIDQVRIYNYARTPAQIALDYNRGGPVGHWKMDDCQGTQVADWSGNGNHGTLTVGASGTQNSVGTCQVGTSAAWTAGSSGKWNGSLNFDGTDDYVNIGGSSPTLQITGDITISSWVKTTNANYQITIDDLGSSPFTSWCQWLNPSGNIVWYDNGTWRASTRSVNDGQWHHIVTVVSNNTLSYYIDGKADPSIYSNILARTATSDSKRIGTRADGISYPFRGQLDDIRVYNYAMTTTQIKQLYNNGAITFN